jgi:hypothetical protein
MICFEKECLSEIKGAFHMPKSIASPAMPQTYRVADLDA